MPDALYELIDAFELRGAASMLFAVGGFGLLWHATRGPARSRRMAVLGFGIAIASLGYLGYLGMCRGEFLESAQDFFNQGLAPVVPR